MTLDANAGSAPAGIPAATTGTNDQGSNGGAADPFSGLQDAGIREWVGKAGFKDTSATSFEALAKKTRDAESLIGKSVQIPGPDAKPEDRDKFYGKLGRPEKADGYEFKLPDGLPPDLPYNTELLTEFKPVAHKHGLSKEQATGLHDWMVQEGAKAFKADRAALAERVKTVTEAMEKEYGPKDSDGHKKAMADIDRTVRLGGIGEELQQIGAMGPKGLILAPKLAGVLAKAAELFKEDALVSGTVAVAGDNPFASGPDKGNLTDQNVLWNNDRQKAIQLMRSAGFTPEQFGYRQT